MMGSFHVRSVDRHDFPRISYDEIINVLLLLHTDDSPPGMARGGGGRAGTRQGALTHEQ